MHVRRPRYSNEEFERRGTEIYEQKIRPLVIQGHRGRILAIDIDTGDYELGDDILDACPPLIAHPDGKFRCVRIGHRAVERWGFHGSTEEP